MTQRPLRPEMRITDLSIENYGPHSGWNPGSGGIAAGLNVIYGPNEAGKSAIRAFIRMVLFGKMRANAAGAFRFNYTHLSGESGAGSVSIEVADGGRYIFHRVEGKAPTVTGDSSGGEELLQQLIGRVDSTLYQNVFSISLIELESLDSLSADAVKDRIYSAGLGLGSVSLPAAMKQLDDERATPAGLWSPAAGKLRTNLRDLKDRRLELQQKAEALTHYEGLTSDIASLRGQIAGLEENLQAARTKELRYRSINQLRAASARKAAIESGLAELPEARPFPPEGVARLDKLKASLDSVREQINTGNVQASESESALDHLGVVEVFNEARSDILRLLNRHDLYIEAARDLPRVELEADTAHQEIAAGLAAIGETWDEERLEGFVDRGGASRRVNLAGEKLDEARSTAVRHSEAADRAATLLADTQQDETAARRRVERIANVPTEVTDELRVRRDRLERLRAAVVERSESQRSAYGGSPPDGRRTGWFIVFLRAVLNGLRRLIGLGPRPAAPADGKAALTAPSYQDLEQEIGSLVDLLHVGVNPTERELVESLSGADRALARREGFDREQASLEEASARVERASRDAAAASSALQEAEQGGEAVKIEWMSCLASLHLDQSHNLSGAVGALGDLGSLREKLISAKSLHARIDEMTQAVGDIEAKLAPILASAGMRELETLNAGQALDELGQRFRAHQDALASGETLKQRVDSWTKQRVVLEDESKRLQSETATLLGAADCSDGEEEKFRALGDASDSRTTLERDLRRVIEDNPVLSGSDGGGIVDDIGATSPEEIEAKRQTLVDEIKLFEADLGQLREDLGGLEKSRRDAEESNPTSETQAEIDRLEQLVQEDAHRWGLLTVAKQILDAARTEYQSERQAPLMRKASEHFRRITGGAYERVEAIMGEEEIQVVESTGRVKPVTELSRGTAEQLYLAMRFAFIDEYAEHSEPVPVLMDDVLVNFDAERSVAASEAIVEFSREHQILLLTCHEETVDRMKAAAEAARAGGPEIIRL
ncbi:MAG: AAA family ATPase [Chloroflexi bacterium]|nr:AAA family ATPase [Chloroflexota bacterium]